MKNLLVKGIIFVILLVTMCSIGDVNEDIVPDDQTMMDWYVSYNYGPECKAVILDDLTGFLETEYDWGEYIHYDVYDRDGNMKSLGCIKKSYLAQEYERNN
jgi:hypothetical protein